MSTTEQQNLSETQKAKLIEKILAFKLTEHPIIPAPGEEQRRRMIENVGLQEVMRMFVTREQRIRAEQEDPYRYGTELTTWPDADKIITEKNELLILGGNRAGKTEYAAKRIAQMFVGWTCLGRCRVG